MYNAQNSASKKSNYFLKCQSSSFVAFEAMFTFQHVMQRILGIPACQWTSEFLRTEEAPFYKSGSDSPGSSLEFGGWGSLTLMILLLYRPTVSKTQQKFSAIYSVTGFDSRSSSPHVLSVARHDESGLHWPGGHTGHSSRRRLHKHSHDQMCIQMETLGPPGGDLNCRVCDLIGMKSRKRRC